MASFPSDELPHEIELHGGRCVAQQRALPDGGGADVVVVLGQDALQVPRAGGAVGDDVPPGPPDRRLAGSPAGDPGIQVVAELTRWNRARRDVQVEQCPLLLEVLHERGILVRQRHSAEGHSAGESRDESAESLSLTGGDGKFQAVDGKHRRIQSDARISRD
jgi:hypothetical protein